MNEELNMELIDKEIAEFMGLDVVRILDNKYVDFPCFKNGKRHTQKKYTKCLDSLIPFWKKLEKHGLINHYSERDGIYQWELNLKEYKRTFFGRSNTLTESAAIAAFEVILFIKNI